MKGLILGAEGRLGRQLVDSFSRRGPVAGYGHRQVDVTSESEVRSVLSRERPDLVVNAAAWTDVSGAETSASEAYAVNATAVEILTRAVYTHDIPLLHFSTDYVFSGQGSCPWLETDEKKPLEIYGKSKLAGEEVFLRSLARGAIVRVGWLHSGQRDFVSAILSRALSGKVLTVVDNQWGTPSEVGALADWTLASLGGLLSFDGIRVVHYVESGEYVSRFELARYILRRAIQVLTTHHENQLVRAFEEAVEKMIPSSLEDGIRPCNCRLASTRNPYLADTKRWMSGVDKSVEKIVLSKLRL